MTRTDFIKGIAGIFGITIVAPVTYTSLRDIPRTKIFNDPKPEPVKISPLQEYSPKDWSGLTTRHHLGAMPKWNEQDLTVTQFLHKFDK